MNISIIITTHNRLDMLKKAIESVKGQTYKTWECIVVNDASTDNTEEWLNDLCKDDRFQTYFIKVSQGGNHARNIGISLAKGKFIAFLDDDDIWLPEKIEEQVNIFNKDKKVGLVYCGHFVTDGLIKNQIKPNPDNKGDMSKKVFDRIFCTTSMIMIKADLLNKIGNFDEQLRYWQEYDLCIRLCQVTKVEYVDGPLMYLFVNKKDKNRLSNNLDGWKKSVDYINNKYSQIISSLPDQIKLNRQLMIYNDAANRYYMCGNMKEHRRMLKQVWLTTKEPKYFVKYLLNVNNITLSKIRKV